jgi:hypothetical protein
VGHPVLWGVFWGLYFAFLMGFWAWMIFPNHIWRIDVLAGVVGAPIVGTVGWFAWHTCTTSEAVLKPARDRLR